MQAPAGPTGFDADPRHVARLRVAAVVAVGVAVLGGAVALSQGDVPGAWIVLAAVALALLHAEPPLGGRRVAGAFTATLAVVLAATSLFSWPVRVVSPLFAACALGLAGGIGLLSSRRASAAAMSQWLVVPGIVAALLCLVANLYAAGDAAELRGFGLSLNSQVDLGLLALGCGVLFARPAQGWMPRRRVRPWAA